MQYASAREFFEAVRDAVRDLDACERQLDALELDALRLPGPSLEPHVSGGEYDHMAARVARLVDREEELRRRMEDDSRLIDAACAVLYGEDGVSDGLATLAPGWWADVLYHFYVAGRTWPEVGALLCYSPQHCRRTASAAFDAMDANGMMATVNGTGMAEG